MASAFVLWTEDIHPWSDLELSSSSERTASLGGHAAAAKQESRNLPEAARPLRCENMTRSSRETSIKVESKVMNFWAVEKDPCPEIQWEKVTRILFRYGSRPREELCNYATTRILG